MHKTPKTETLKDLNEELLLVTSVNYILRHGGEAFVRIIARIKDGTRKEEVHQFRMTTDIRTIDFDAPVNEGGDTLIDQTTSRDPGPDDVMVGKDRWRVIELLLDELKPSEKDVMCRRYGLNGYEHQTLQEIGDEKHVTRERIRQIEANALRKLRHKFRLRGFDRSIV